MERAPELDNRVVILNGFSDPEIIAIMNVVKAIYADEDLGRYARFVTAVNDHPDATDFARRLLRVFGAAKETPQAQSVSTGDLIFAKATENSLKTTLGDLIVDMSGDHAYLKANPPGAGAPGPGAAPAGAAAPDGGDS